MTGRRATWAIGLTSLAMSAQVLADAPASYPTNVVMWRDVRSGMDRSVFNATFLKHKADLSPGCPMVILGRFKKGKLVSLFLEDRSGVPACFADEKRRLIARYGEGTTKLKKFNDGYVAGMIFINNGKYEETDWISGPMRIRYLSIGIGYAPNIYYTVQTNGKF